MAMSCTVSIPLQTADNVIGLHPNASCNVPDMQKVIFDLFKARFSTLHVFIIEKHSLKLHFLYPVCVGHS